jgi:hypothetical protein
MVANGDALPEYECQPLLGMHIYFLSLSLCPLYLASPYFLSLSRSWNRPSLFQLSSICSRSLKGFSDCISDDILILPPHQNRKISRALLIQIVLFWGRLAAYQDVSRKGQNFINKSTKLRQYFASLLWLQKQKARLLCILAVQCL